MQVKDDKSLNGDDGRAVWRMPIGFGATLDGGLGARGHQARPNPIWNTTACSTSAMISTANRIGWLDPDGPTGIRRLRRDAFGTAGSSEVRPARSN